MFKDLKIFLIVYVAFLSTGSAQQQMIPGIDLLSGNDYIEIPFKYVSGYIIVETEINSALPLSLIFDTGAEHTILFEKQLTDLLGLTYQKEVLLKGSDLQEDIRAFISRNVSIQVGKSPRVKRDVIVLAQNFLNLREVTGINIDGILGAQNFKNLVVHIDYKRQKLTIWHPQKFKPRDSHTKTSISIHNNKPYIMAKSTNDKGETHDLKLLIDTGAGLTFLMNSNEKMNITIPENATPGSLGKGLGGFLTGYRGKMASLEFADFTFNNILAHFQELEEPLDPESLSFRNGIIGNLVLERFDVVINYLDETIYLKPTKKLKRPFKYNLSGMGILAFGIGLENYIVFEIIKNSPADKIGIHKGDIIKKIGRIPTSWYSLFSIEQILSRRPGKKIRLKLIRGEEKIEKVFYLEDYLKL